MIEYVQHVFLALMGIVLCPHILSPAVLAPQQATDIIKGELGMLVLRKRRRVDPTRPGSLDQSCVVSLGLVGIALGESGKRPIKLDRVSIPEMWPLSQDEV